jgi:hypothetical protein
MKPTFKILIIAAFLAISPLLSYAQPPHVGDTPPTGDPVGPAGAPIGNGTLILLTLAAAYAVKKVYDLRAVKEEEVTE